MHNRDKYPAIWKEKEKAEKALAPLMEKRKVHTDEMAKVQLEIQGLKNKKAILNDSAMEDIEEIRNLREIESRMARAMGAKVAGEK